MPACCRSASSRRRGGELHLHLRYTADAGGRCAVSRASRSAARARVEALDILELEAWSPAALYTHTRHTAHAPLQSLVSSQPTRHSPRESPSPSRPSPRRQKESDTQTAVRLPFFAARRTVPSRSLAASASGAVARVGTTPRVGKKRKGKAPRAPQHAAGKRDTQHRAQQGFLPPYP